MKRLFSFIALVALTISSQAQKPRPFYGLPFEVKDKILIGGSFTTLAEYKSMNEALGATSGTYLCYVGFATSSFGSVWASTLVDIKKVPKESVIIIDIPFATKINGSGVAAMKAWATTNTWDKNAQTLIDDCHALNRRIIFGVAYEFDHPNNHYYDDKPNFKLGYQKFVTLYRKTGSKLLSNAWVSAGMGSGRATPEKMWLYPGDAYVDRWGYDHYEPQQELANLAKVPRFPAFCDSAAAHKKRVIIVESAAKNGFAVSRGQYSWDNWFKPTIQFFYDNPAVEMWNYCNIDMAANSAAKASGFTGDSRIQSNPIVFANFLAAMLNPIWITGDGKTAVELPPKYDTTKVRVFFPVSYPVTHDTIEIKDSIRLDIKRVQ